MTGLRLPSWVLALTLVACGGSHSSPPPTGGAPSGPPSAGASVKRELRFPVELQLVEARSLSPLVRATGSIEAWEEVRVTARVSGAVEEVHFTEGDEVVAGSVLLSIEPERFELAERAARAAWEKERIEAEEAASALARREAIDRQSPELVADEELLTFRTRLLAATADSERAEATWKQAELDVRHARVRAPTAGRIETRSVDTGAWVQPGATLATLLKVEPLLLRFAVSPDEAARLTVGSAASYEVPGSTWSGQAKIRHISGRAVEGSRQVSVVAEVQDAPQGLRPGTFAQVELQVGEAQPRPVVPQSAVRPSERGFLAYVVQDDQAQERILRLGLRTDDGLIEVVEGLVPGEPLVVRGAEALKDGAPVTVVGTPP